MGNDVTYYAPSRNYFWLGVTALLLAGFCGWCATQWTPAAAPAGLLAASAVLLLFFSTRPPVGISAEALLIGGRRIPWSEIRRVDRTGWVSPLVLRIALRDRQVMYLIYPGDLDASQSLLRQIRRMARKALLDGIPYNEFWRMEARSAGSRQLPSPKYQILRPEDEAEVELLYARLKAAGRLEPNTPKEEK